MTLTDYAKYLLSVCGKRFTNLYRRHYLESTPALPSLSALLSYLKTQTASIFTQIKARGAVHPLSGLPATETLATLPTAIATLSTRKVDVGISTQIDDGLSLVRLLCDSTESSKVTELVDTNSWDNMTNRQSTLLSLFPNITKLELGCRKSGYALGSNNLSKLSLPNLEEMTNESDCRLYCPNASETIVFPKLKKYRFGIAYANSNYINIPYFYFPELEEITSNGTGSNSYASFFGAFRGRVLTFPKLKHMEMERGYGGNTFIYNNSYVEELNLPAVTYWMHAPLHGTICNMPNLVSLRFDSIKGFTSNSNTGTFVDWLKNCPNLIDFRVGYGFNNNLSLPDWSPTITDANRATFLSNFQTYIVNRLSTSVTNKTLTLSSAVFTAITNAGIAAPTGWTFVNAGN